MMYRVLVADDEPIERMIVGRTIKKYFSGQLEVVEAVNGREAAKFFTEKDCKIRDFALKNKSPCSACEFQAKQGISILGIKLLFFSV